MLTTKNTESTITETQALLLEQIEALAWMDMYSAAPADFAQGLRIVQQEQPDMVLVSAALPVGLFNKTFLHGLNRPLDAEQIDRIKTFFEANNAMLYQVYLTPFSKPCYAGQLLLEHGFKHAGATDKVICDPRSIEPDQSLPADGLSVQTVNASNSASWASFICSTYNGLPNHPWLAALVNRKGWHHVLAEKNGKIVACRSMYIAGECAWLGIDAPIPGLMTDDYLPDQLLTRHLLQTAREQGVTLVNSCIEAVDPSRQTPAYQYLYALGFTVAYTRNLYSPA